MKLNQFFVLAALVSSPAVALAYPKYTLDFDGPTSFASIDNYYNGGTDSAGAVGPAYGVTFGLDALALQNDDLGPYFSNAPTPIGVMTAVGPDATMNVDLGFKEFSFYYSSSEAIADAVQIWSEPNGLGTLLASFDLMNNAQMGCTDSPYCNFGFSASGPLADRAYSVTFANAANAAVFDNVAVNIPEPSTALLAALGLTGMLSVRRRR